METILGTEGTTETNGVVSVPEPSPYLAADRVDALENMTAQMLNERARRLEAQRDLLVTQLGQVKQEMSENDAAVAQYQQGLRLKYGLGPTDAVNVPEGTIVRQKMATTG